MNQRTHTDTQTAQRTHTDTQTNQTAIETDRATLLEWAYRVARHPAVCTDPELLACAEGRIALFKAGIYLQADVEGLLDWADEEGWR